MNKMLPLLLVLGMALIIQGNLVFGQIASSQEALQGAVSPAATQSAQSLATLQAYQKEQLAIFKQEQALLDGGATPKQMAAWRLQNAALFATQLQRAQSMTVASEQQLQVTNHGPDIPANASTGLSNVLTNQATLAAAYAKIRNPLLQSAGGNLTYSQVGQLEHEANNAMRQQNAALLTLQAQQAQALTAASPPPLQTEAAPLVIPTNASPQLVAFLTTRHQLQQAMVQLRNQNATAGPATRAAALQNFYKQNAGLIAQMQQQGQALTPSSASTIP